MQIDRIYYPVETLGFGKRIGIWTYGCSHRCNKCSNPELWDEREDKEISISDILCCIQQIDEADGITITGGDPFYQVDDLYELLYELRKLGFSDILVYTGFSYSELRELGQKERDTLRLIDVLIDGLYVDELNDNKSIRGSSNQGIHILNPELSKRYEKVENWERKTQIVMNGTQIQAIGIPLKSN